MRIKKVIITGAAAAMFAGSLLNVSAAESPNGAYVKALKESGKENLIIDVAAYRAAYSDLDEAFGDNEDAYIMHYLTAGVFEGRTKGVLFNPLAYAAAYGDISAAFGDDISAIVDHYVTFGVAENRTVGTANGYEDIAAAQKAETLRTAAPGNSNNTNAASVNNGAGTGASTNSSIPASGNSGAGAAASASSNSAASANSGNEGSTSNTSNTQSYGHITRIYSDESHSVLIRVEYYDDANRLCEYSDVENYDAASNSYTEKVYRHDEATGGEVLLRTDTYVNGVRVSSQ